MHNIIALIGIVLKRLYHNLGLSASSVIGIVSILTVAVCVPIYSHAVSSEVLHQQLIAKKGSTNRRLFAIRLSFVEKLGSPQMDYQKSHTIANFLKDQIEKEMGLPVKQIVMDIRSPGITVTDLTGRWPEARTAPLSRWNFIIQPILPSHAKIVEGEWPKPDTTRRGPIQVAVPENMADEMLLKIGDRFLLDPLEVEIVGFYQINNPNDSIWFNNPNSDYSWSLWVPEETYLARIVPATETAMGEVAWHVVIDDKDIHFQRAAQYLSGWVRLDSQLKKMVAGIKADYTPVDALIAYEKRADELATLFYVVGSPMLVLALIFIGLTATIAVQQNENETATLRSRGASRAEVSFLNIMESLILLAIALPLSIGSGWLAALMMGKTLSFLQFTDRDVFPFSFDGLNYTIIFAAVMVIIIARFIPMISGSKITITRVKQDQSRGGARPIWERYFLDFFLLLPGGYAYFVLRGWSKPAAFLSQLQLSGQTQFRDPLLFVAPALFAMSLCMILLRFVPLIIRLLAGIVEKLPGVWAYLSLQQVARRSNDYSSALLLIMISLSLSIFTVSTAKTLDRWLYDSEYYKVGADLAVQEYIVATGGANAGPDSGGAGASARTNSGQLIESFLSIEEHLEFPGVNNATRFGKYDGKFSYGRGEVNCLVIGIDRVEYPKTGYYRDDFANQDLGTLMNLLGSDLNSVIFPSSMMNKTGVAVGDQIALTVSIGSQKFDREMRIVGKYNYFPTVFPKDKPTLIVNLESIFDYPEDVEGYHMLLDVSEDTDIPALVQNIQNSIAAEQALVKVSGNALSAVQAGKDKPERIGLFGILNVGFVTTGLMPGIGFLLYSYASLRRRFIQLGILQAIGLSVRQLIASLILEQSVLMSLAILIGAAAGLISSILFVPYLQTSATPGAPVPPFLVVIGWIEAGWLSLAFGIVLFITMLGTIIYLARLKVFQAVKLGETI